LQALGWYLTFLLSIFVIAVVIGGSLEFLDIEQTFEGAYLDVQVVIALCHIVLGIMLLWNRPKSAINVLLALLGVASSVPSGALVALIPFAVLTTRPSNISPEVKKVFE
jgi:hypothetical protein